LKYLNKNNWNLNFINEKIDLNVKPKKENEYMFSPTLSISAVVSPMKDVSSPCFSDRLKKFINTKREKSKFKVDVEQSIHNN
jgi:hypothetical protein